MKNNYHLNDTYHLKGIVKFYESSSRDVQKRLSRYKTQSQAPLFLQTRRRKQQNITPTYLDINQN